MNRVISSTSRMSLLLLTPLLLVACATSGPGITGADGAGAHQSIAGDLRYEERVALAQGARAHLVLRDDAGGVVARHVLSVQGAPPFPYRIAYDPNALLPGSRYTLSAEIVLADGNTGWVSAAPVAAHHGETRAPLALALSAVGHPKHDSGFELSCDGLGGHVYYNLPNAQLLLPDRSIALHATRSASGARYEGAGVLLWSKGEQASLEVDGLAYQDCRLSAQG